MASEFQAQASDPTQKNGIMPVYTHSEVKIAFIITHRETM